MKVSGVVECTQCHDWGEVFDLTEIGFPPESSFRADEAPCPLCGGETVLTDGKRPN